jgi:hypothetical protein
MKAWKDIECISHMQLDKNNYYTAININTDSDPNSS